MLHARSYLALMVLALIGSACQEVPDRRDVAPPDAPVNRMQASAVQDSLQAGLEPGTFRAVLKGDAFDAGEAGTLINLHLEGEAVVDTAALGEASAPRVRFALHDAHGTARVDLELELMPAARGRARLVPAVFQQQLDNRRPTVHAVLHEGRRRFTSQSGTLVLSDVGEYVRGNFFFEMHSVSLGSEDDWFELVGVLETRHK